VKKINCWNDLAPFGIEILTGEACGLSYRLLCDVTEKGRKILSVAFGIPDFTLAEAWNTGTTKEPHIGSILLADSMLTPVGIFALLENGCREVWLYKNDSMLGIEPSDSPELVQLWEKMAPEALARKFRYGGTAGSRNQHVMSGRIE
jgi:hypothetical protein